MAPKAVLIGLPGSGKSTIGRRLAKAMGCALIDTDAVIEERSGRTIAEIFAAEGESGFRRIEEQVIREALGNHDGILSLGGGARHWPAIRSSTWKSAPPRAFAGPVAAPFVRCWPDPIGPRSTAACWLIGFRCTAGLRRSGSTPIGEIPGRWFAISLADLRIRSPRDGGGHRGGGPPPTLPHRR